MAQISYRRHRFPPEIIQHAIWLYVRFTLGYRDVEELLAERGLDISYETVRRWVLKFGPAVARRLRQRRPRSSNRWHLDEMVVPIAGKRMYLWRAVDHEGEVLDMLVQRRRDSRAALRLMRKLLKKQGSTPEAAGHRQAALVCLGMPPITAASSSTAQPAGDQKRVALPQHTIEFGERVHGFGRRELRYRAAAGREDAAPIQRSSQAVKFIRHTASRNFRAAHIDRGSPVARTRFKVLI